MPPRPKKAPAKPGRRPKIMDDERRERLLTAIRGGNYLQTACAYAGLGQSTFYDWQARGRTERERIEDGQQPDPDEAEYLQLLVDVEKARADAEVRAVTLIRKAGQEGAWQAEAWWLERTMPQRYGRFSRTEVSGPEGGPVEVKSRVSVDEIAQAIDALLGDDEAPQA